MRIPKVSEDEDQPSRVSGRVRSRPGRLRGTARLTLFDTNFKTRSKICVCKNLHGETRQIAVGVIADSCKINKTNPVVGFTRISGREFGVKSEESGMGDFSRPGNRVKITKNAFSI